MRWSQLYVPTLKEAPADAEVVSHKLLVRAGMIRKLTAGVYNYLPLGMRVVTKVAAIVREEMNRSGAQEVLLAAMQPADLWKESGRWEQYGKELLRFQDRHDRQCCLGPTHEEVVTDLIRGELRSYRQLPVTLYQIQTKFRDEIRPRFGLMRGREFIMKDAYSFDRDDAGADISYWTMYEAYKRIFTRLGLRFSAVEADSGAIGGNFSHEFMVLAETGEDTIAVCAACGYAANLERAAIGEQELAFADGSELPPYKEVFTPAQHTIEELSEFLRVDPQEIIKTILLDVDGRPVAVLVRGDREVNLVKVKNYFDATEVEFATPEQILAWTGAPVGFAGPVKLKIQTIIADEELRGREGWIVGANKEDVHLSNVSLARDAAVTAYADLRSAEAGDPCPRCGGALQLQRGIEVGHVFKLGTKYSQAMNAVFVDEFGEELPIIMGCYGIGVTRIVAACIEQNHDENGIIFPPSLAPYEVLLINLDPGNVEIADKAEGLYGYLQQMGLEVLLDDREERPGVKFKDGDLIGVPMQLVLGGKGFAQGIIEAKDRRTGVKITLPLDDFVAAFAQWREQVYAGWEEGK